MMKKQHKLFADEMIRHGDSLLAYSSAYPNAKPNAARVNGYRLLQNATISEYIKVESEKIAAIVRYRLAEELKDKELADLLGRHEKRSILAQIARGEMMVSIKKPVWDATQKKFVTVPILEVPNHSDRMKAIQLDSLMTGEFAPLKSQAEITGKDGKAIEHVYKVTLNL